MTHEPTKPNIIVSNHCVDEMDSREMADGSCHHGTWSKRAEITSSNVNSTPGILTDCSPHSASSSTSSIAQKPSPIRDSSTHIHSAMGPLSAPLTISLDGKDLEIADLQFCHAASVPTADASDANIKQPVSAPALMHRKSASRGQVHKRRPSVTPNVSGATSAGHFSRPIEMPPEVSAGGLRIDSTAVTANLATLERVQSGNNSEFVNKLSGSERRDANRGGGGHSIKKQITKFSKIAGGGHRKKVKDGEVVFKGHRNWEIVLSIQFGLKYTSELLEDANGTEPTAKDYEESLAFDFNPVEEQRSAFEVNKFAKWVHPAPFVYKAIRRRFGVSEKDFLDATCGESRVRELPTPGKSGALFYITEDERYFMKTIQQIEEKMLVSMLPSYYEHICSNPNTLLTRYMAHFSVQTRRDRHIRMVVMASIFNDQIFVDRKFDLKGSTFKRFASPEQLQSENVTLKDQDFEEAIFFRPEVVKMLMGQLARDSSFLESHQVMDYSLLLGISDMYVDEDAYFKEAFGVEEEQAPYFVGYQRDAKGEKMGVRVSMGIIDFLQRFRFRKKVEYGMRVLQSCSSAAASVAPPHVYRERFMDFLASRFLPDPDLDITNLKLQH